MTHISSIMPDIEPTDNFAAVAVLVSSTLSLLGSAFIIGTFVAFSDARKFSRRLLVYLSIADAGASASWFASSILWFLYDNDKAAVSAADTADAVGAIAGSASTGCVAQGFLLQFFSLSSYMWTACFAYHLFQLLWVRGRGRRAPEAYARRYHAVGWGVPAAILLYFVVAWATGREDMGRADRPWCWIKSERHDGSWDGWGATQQFLFFYLPLLVVFVFNGATYAFLLRKAGGLLGSAALAFKVRKRLLLYLLVFAGCSVWGLLARSVHALSAAHANTPVVAALMRLDAALGPSQGFWNAVVYGLNSRMRARLARGCCGWCRGGGAGGADVDDESGFDSEEDGEEGHGGGLLGSKFSQSTGDGEGRDDEGDAEFTSPLRHGNGHAVEVYGTPGTGGDEDDPAAIFLQQREGGARTQEEEDALEEGLEGGGGPYYAYYQAE